MVPVGVMRSNSMATACRCESRVGGTLHTRNGLDWTNRFSAIAKAGGALPDCIIDGEIVALDEHDAPSFPSLQAALSDGMTNDLVYFAFDLLFHEDGDLRSQPLAERKSRLERILSTAESKKGAPGLRYVEHLEDPGETVLRSACELSLEGIVSKKLSAPYRSGRNDNWTNPNAEQATKLSLVAGATRMDASAPS